VNAYKTILCYALLASASWQMGTLACPFCSAPSQTLSEEIAAADVVVIARLVKVPPEVDLDSNDPAGFDIDDPNSGMAEFELIETLRGETPPQDSTIKVVYFGSGDLDKQFMISGIAGKQIDWTTPLPLTERSTAYLKILGTLPEKGPDRLTFFMGHLEDTDPLLAQDAYDEFARAPYELVTAISDRMDRKQLIAWIEDSQIGPTRRRLYLTMLGVCGQAEDIAILESLLLYDHQLIRPGIATMLAVMAQTGPIVGVPIIDEMIKSDVRRKQQCLDALIAAYLKLKGPEGLPLIERRFLTNPAAEYSHLYAAVMALRFHGEETDVLPRPRLLETMRLLLANEEIADQVIPDLARWEDWSILDQLVTMFKESETGAWVRPPVISYLLVAAEQPAEIGQRANTALAELEKMDPKGVKRARRYMNFGMLAGVGTKRKPKQAVDAAKPSVAEQTAIDKTTDKTTDQPLDSQSTPAAVAPDAPTPSRMLIFGAPLIAGLILFGLFALLLRGTDVRSSSDGS